MKLLYPDPNRRRPCFEYPGSARAGPRHLYAGQEAEFRALHGTADGFKIEKGVCQGCILSPYLFNFYAEYIM